MCSISALFCPDISPIADMSRTMTHRGPDSSGVFTDTVCDCNVAQSEYKVAQSEYKVALAHNRLSVIDPEGGAQPMSAVRDGVSYTIIYNGEIYNYAALRAELELRGAVFKTKCDTEAVLWSYIIWGASAPVHLNGIFAFMVYDSSKKSIYFARDRFGVKPLFWAKLPKGYAMASEIKALLAHPDIAPKVDHYGIWQALFLTPVTIPKTTLYRDIFQIGPGECGYCDGVSIHTHKYWQLEAAPCVDDSGTAAEVVRALMFDTVKRQLVSDVPICTFLSGGLDSSVVTAIGAGVMRSGGRVLSSYSFEYEGNRQNFVKSLFQPASDDEYAPDLAAILGTDHTVLRATDSDVAELLEKAEYYRDIPGQADIDSSLLYYCSEVRKRHTVALSGECSDEIFGGYPWFYRPEMLHRDFFPWIHDPFARTRLFRSDFAKADEGFAQMSDVYKKTVSSVEAVEGESEEDHNARIATVLSTDYFMANLLERKDRMSMASSLEVRVPFADHRIAQYVYNLPWSIKFEGGVEKALLRNAMKGVLPDRFLWRKKSPYPKTHSPAYEKLVSAKFEQLINSDTPLAQVIDRSAAEQMLSSEGGIWFGQLMGKAQLLGWLIQFGKFLERVELV